MKIQEYIAKKSELSKFNQWRSMIGKKYSGGGGGVGKVHSVSLNKIEVYYQERDGSTNYHELEKSALRAVEKVIVEHINMIIGEAYQFKEKELKEFAAEALAEVEQIKKDAGLYETDK